MNASDFLGIDLPPDETGLLWDKSYVPFHKAGRTNNMGTGESVFGLKTGRPHECLSQHEARALYCFEFNRCVLAILDQYPAFERTLLEKLVANPDYRPSTAECPTLDFVVALGDRSDLHNVRRVGVSIKEKKELGDPAVIRRFHRDYLYCKELGWGWFLLTEVNIPRVSAGNAYLLHTWIKDIELEQSDSQAWDLAQILPKSDPTLELATRLERASRALQVSEERMTHVLAWSVCRGFLHIDMKKPLALRKRLFLAPNQ